MMMLLVLFLGISLAVTQAQDEKCYPPYGCFNRNPPYNIKFVGVNFFGVDMPLPQPIQTVFHLVSKSSDVIINDNNANKLQTSGYDGSKKTIIVIHGFTENVDASKWITELKNALLNQDDTNFNLIIADWKEGAEGVVGLNLPVYTYAWANTRLVGAQIAYMIQFLNNQTGNSPSSFHLIGFSLGAQVAGNAGKRIQSPKIGRITGLDPAGPYYYNQHTDVRLDISDAAFVDVIHTDAYGFGLIERSGHLDFYPNGGRSQRGCVAGLIASIQNISCDHISAPWYYIDSVRNEACIGYQCANWDDFIGGNCMSCANGCPKMGHHASMADSTKPYYLYTNKQAPYSVARYILQVTFRTARNTKWWWPGYTGGKNPVIRLSGSNGNSADIDDVLRRNVGSSMSTEVETAFKVVPVGEDIGTLSAIKVKNSKSTWKPIQVTLEFGNDERFYGCFNGQTVGSTWVTVDLQSGSGNCTQVS